MKTIVLEWNSYGTIESTLRSRGNEVCVVEIDTHAVGDALHKQEQLVRERIREGLVNTPDEKGYVFTYNYFPWVSNICQELGARYVSWIYDSPYMDLYSFTITNSVNDVYVFDYGVYQEFEAAGIETVHYLPLGVDAIRYQEMKDNESELHYDSDISFVGSLYTEPKHRLYDKFATLPAYTRGYLDAVIEAQKNIYGENILENFLTDEMIAQMEKCYPTDPNPTTVMTPRQIYAQFVLARQVTSLERSEILGALGGISLSDMSIEDLDVDRVDGVINRNLYTQDTSTIFSGWKTHGPIDYYSEMPGIFRHSKINLNITLRSIVTGIPLRALDIMASGGFLLSNYQPELAEYFVPGEDFVFYEDQNDLIAKVKYYLTHDDERESIAKNGYNKVMSEHTLDKRLDIIEARI